MMISPLFLAEESVKRPTATGTCLFNRTLKEVGTHRYQLIDAESTFHRPVNIPIPLRLRGGWCAVKDMLIPAGANSARLLSLRPVAPGASFYDFP